MALDPAIADALNGQLIAGATSSSELNRALDRNLTQGLGVIQNTLIQQQGAVSDDPGLLASLQSASRSPAQGQTPVGP